MTLFIWRPWDTPDSLTMWSVVGTLGHVVSNHPQEGLEVEVSHVILSKDSGYQHLGELACAYCHTLLMGKLMLSMNALTETTGSSVCGTFRDSAPCVSSLGFFNLRCFTVTK